MGHFIGPLVKIPPKVTLAHVVCPARERESNQSKRVSDPASNILSIIIIRFLFESRRNNGELQHLYTYRLH